MTTPRALAVAAFVLGALAAVVGSARPPVPSARSEPVGISAIELTQWQQAHKTGLRLIDLRPSDAFDASHIPGAEDVPLVMLAGATFTPGETIVLYGETEARADQAWMLLQARGLTRIYVLRGGFAGWSGTLNARRRGC